MFDQKEIFSRSKWIWIIAVLSSHLLGGDVSFPAGWNATEIQPIECYAIFIDQDGNPVRNARVEAAVITAKPGGTGYERKEIPQITDNNGIIHVVGERGGRLWMRISNSEYTNGSTSEFDPGGATLIYSKISSDGNRNYGTVEKPFNVLVWRHTGLQPLIEINGKASIHYNADPLQLDLRSGKLINDGGDIIIKVKQPLSDADMALASQSIGPDAFRLGIFPWSCEVSILNGGFYEIDATDFDLHTYGVFNRPMVTSRSFSFSGFRNNIEMNMLVRTRLGTINGKIKLQIDSGFTSYKGNILIEATGLVNITGSPSLELDPTKLLKVKLIDARNVVPK